MNAGGSQVLNFPRSCPKGLDPANMMERYRWGQVSVCNTLYGEQGPCMTSVCDVEWIAVQYGFSQVAFSVLFSMYRRIIGSWRTQSCVIASTSS